MQGTVKFFNEKKGFGFISSPGQAKDVFVHFSGIDMPGFKVLAEGDNVVFEVEQGDKGPQAVGVRKV